MRAQERLERADESAGPRLVSWKALRRCEHEAEMGRCLNELRREDHEIAGILCDECASLHRRGSEQCSIWQTTQVGPLAHGHCVVLALAQLTGNGRRVHLVEEQSQADAFWRLHALSYRSAAARSRAIHSSTSSG